MFDLLPLVFGLLFNNYYCLYNSLNRWPAMCIHGDKSQPERDWVLNGMSEPLDLQSDRQTDRQTDR